MMYRVKPEQLTAYLAGELPWWRRLLVRRAIRRNAETRQLFRELEAVWWKLDDWHSATPPEGMPDSFRRAFRDEFGRFPVPVPHSRARRVGFAPGWALAATAAMAVIVVVYSNSNKPAGQDELLIVERLPVPPASAMTTAMRPAPATSNMVVASVPTVVSSAPIPSPTAGDTGGIIRMGERPIRSHRSVVPMPVVSRNSSHTVGLQGAAAGGLSP